ncbi:MAG: type IV pili methyl-accepting chemotaxis transducer N-terminal domain-containing protein, partial [Gammaproteobacteria bacterium]|nr:type IV pili methyl-accepting chemotaxis transducer N-terminal domain-containing protein [Gammaproteobacteria bacterium]
MPLCKRFTALLTLMLMLAGTVVADEGLTMGVALDKAGRQRMLTQHMLKSYALTGMKLRIGADADLRKAAELFETQLSELTGFAANDAERAQIG